MSITVETVSTGSNSISSDSADSFVMVPKSQSLSGNVDVSEDQSVDHKESSDIQGNVLPEAASVENEMCKKLFYLAKENEELKETLKHNNATLQKHINDFSEMQDQYKTNNEAVKKEHQKAKEVVTKLRNENKSLKEQLKSLQLQYDIIFQKGREAELEKENTFLKQQINMLQEQIAHIDKEMKAHPFSEAATESWQQLVGSIVSYEYQTGMLSAGLGKQHCTSDNASSLEDRYAKLETEKEILKVDFDKMKIEKNHMEEQLIGMLEEKTRLQTNFEHVSEEKEELEKRLNDSYEKDTRVEHDRQKLKDMVESYKTMVKNINENLQKESQIRSKVEQEKREAAEKYDAQIRRMHEEFKQKLSEIELENLKKVNENEEQDSVSREKYESIKKLYLKYEMEVDKIEEEKNKLQEQVKYLGKEKYNLEEELNNMKKGMEMKIQEKRELMQQELESCSEVYKEKLSQLHLELEEGRNREEHHQVKLDALQSDIEEGKKREEVLCRKLDILQSTFEKRGSREDSLQDQVCHLIQENDSLSIKIEKLTELNSRRDTLYDERVKKMENEFHRKELEKSSIIEMLKVQLGSSKEETKKYQDRCQVLKMEDERLATQHDSLLKEYDELLNSFNRTLEENRNKGSDTMAEIDNYKRQIDMLTAENSCLNEALHKKDHQLKKKDEELQNLQAYKDNVPILKQQLEIYRNDFQVERAARERQQTDLLHHQEENERLKLANEDLQREVDNVSNNQMAELQRRHGNHLTQNSMIGSLNPQSFQTGFFRRGGDPELGEGLVPIGQDHYAEQPEEPYPCPGCRHNFARFSELEAHVRECPAYLHGNGPPHHEVGNSQPSCPKCGNEFPDLDTLQIHVLECLDS